jgi:hypothetical protein
MAEPLFGGGHLTIGHVVDVCAAARSYIVKAADIADSFECLAVDVGAGGSALSPSSIGMYAIDSCVLVYIPYVTTKSDIGETVSRAFRFPGYIIGAVPLKVASISDPVDWIYQFGGVDVMNNTAENSRLKVNSTVTFDPSKSPRDVMPASETGSINEFGVTAGMGRFMAWLRASDAAGVWCFYLDNLVRIASYNWEHWTCGSDHWIKNDEGEINDVELFTQYPWEGMGAYASDTDVYVLDPNGSNYKQGQFKLSHDVKYSDQLMIPRQVQLRGFIGDTCKEVLVAPKSLAAEASTVERYTNKTEHMGLMEIQKHIDGLYSIRSARGIVLEKYVFIPAPKQLAPPEETSDKGDTAPSYYPSGVKPSTASDDITAADHDKRSWTWSKATAPYTWAAELFDAHAYLFNWYGIQSLLKHEKDWHIPNEGKLPVSDSEREAVAESEDTSEVPVADDTGVSGAYAPTELLASSFSFALPKFAELKMDHRQGSSRYYFSRSCVELMEDGSVLLEDGYGSSIMLSGGNIFVSCAGDHWVRTGRSSITWAGDDFVARAGSSADVSAGQGDLRLKAEHNCHILGGNSGVDGGVLIESRSAYPEGGEFVIKDVKGEDVVSFGIILKSTVAPVMTYGSDIYLRGISRNVGGGEDVGGGIILEADRHLAISAESNMRFAKYRNIDVYGQQLKDGTTLSSESFVNLFDKTDAVFNQTQRFKVAANYPIFSSKEGQVLMAGSLGMSGNVVPYTSTLMDTMIAAQMSAYETWLTSGTSDDTFPGIILLHYTESYLEGICGDIDFIEFMGFTCRTPEQYGLGDDFEVPEARWQQMYRAVDLKCQWVEPRINTPGAAADYSQPHPGYELWTQEARLLQYDPELWSWEDGSNVERTRDPDGKYGAAITARDAGASKQFSSAKLATDYLISQQLTPPEEE